MQSRSTEASSTGQELRWKTPFAAPPPPPCGASAAPSRPGGDRAPGHGGPVRGTLSGAPPSRASSTSSTCGSVVVRSCCPPCSPICEAASSVRADDVEQARAESSGPGGGACRHAPGSSVLTELVGSPAAAPGARCVTCSALAAAQGLGGGLGTAEERPSSGGATRSSGTRPGPTRHRAMVAVVVPSYLRRASSGNPLPLCFSPPLPLLRGGWGRRAGCVGPRIPFIPYRALFGAQAAERDRSVGFTVPRCGEKNGK
jgi:hypothetical protein